MTTQTKEELQATLNRDWLGAKEAAKLLDRTTQLVWHQAKLGRIETLRTSAGVLYSRADLERIVSEREGQGR